MANINPYFNYLREVLGIKDVFVSQALLRKISDQLSSADRSAAIQLLVPASRTHQESQLLDKIKRAIEAKVTKTTSVGIQGISGQIKSLQISAYIPTYFIIFGGDLLSSDLKSKDWNRGILKTDIPSCAWMWTYALSEMEALSPEQQSKRMQLKQVVWSDIQKIISSTINKL